MNSFYVAIQDPIGPRSYHFDNFSRVPVKGEVIHHPNGETWKVEEVGWEISTGKPTLTCSLCPLVVR
jgi:hypothetical protein